MGGKYFLRNSFLYLKKTMNKKKSSPFEYQCIDGFIYTIQKIICVKRKKNT